MRAGKAIFVPVKVGIAGERYFEVTSGLEDGDRVITGPFDCFTTLRSGESIAPIFGAAASFAACLAFLAKGVLLIVVAAG